MRKIVLSLAAAGAAIASPAAAQYYPQPQPAPYGHGYGNGFQGNWGEVRGLHARIDNLSHAIAVVLDAHPNGVVALRRLAHARFAPAFVRRRAAAAPVVRHTRPH